MKIHEIHHNIVNIVYEPSAMLIFAAGWPRNLWSLWTAKEVEEEEEGSDEEDGKEEEEDEVEGEEEGKEANLVKKSVLL